MGKNLKIANKVGILGLLINILLAVIKFVVGILAFSRALISDAIDSVSDCFSSLILIIGINMSAKKADKEHPYGHERLESVAALILSAILLITAFAIGSSGVSSIIQINKGENVKMPTALALYTSIFAILIKEGMFWYTRAAAKKINSSILMADAWHHRSDMLTSLTSFIGIGGAMLGIYVLDSAASIVIALFILKAVYSIVKVAVNQLIDKATDDETVAKVKDIIMGVDGVNRIDDLKTRQYGNKVYVDVEIAVDGSLVLTDAHAIAEKVHNEVEDRIEQVKHCMVHINPDDYKNNHN